MGRPQAKGRTTNRDSESTRRLRRPDVGNVRELLKKAIVKRFNIGYYLRHRGSVHQAAKAQTEPILAFQREIPAVRFYLKVCVVVTLFFCGKPALFAQVTGSITGTVRDTSGAVVPDAKVSVFNTVRGIHRDTVSNSSGDYLVQGLGEGTYTVKITDPGYKTYQAENTVLRVGQNARVDADLSVGSQTTEVDVEGSSAGTIETQSSELSTTVTSKQISQLELNGRSFVQLVELSPGVSNQTGQSAGTTGPAGSVSYSINGGRTEYNNWEIDGGDVLDSGSMSNLNVFPNVDALDQVQVLTSSYDAQYGRSGSGAIEAVTKSGTNQFHGEVFEFYRNQALNAQNYFYIPGERSSRIREE